MTHPERIAAVGRVLAPGVVSLLVSTLAATSLGACAIFPPLGDVARPRIEAVWGERLYDLEMLAYHPQESGVPAWMKSADTPASGMLVVPTRDRRITALEADTGRRIWSVSTTGANVAAPVAIPGTEDLLVASVDGTLYRLRQRNGREVWRSDAAGAAMVASPVIAGDPASDKAMVLVTSLDNRVSALSLATGQLLWSAQRPHDAELTIASQGGALAVGDRVFVGFSDGVLAAYAAEDGATVWTADLAGDKRDFADIDSTPLRVHNEQGEELVVATVFRRGLFALTAEGGDVAWHVRGEGFGHTTVHDGLIAVGQASGRVWAIDAASGKVRWISDVGTGWTGRPMMTSKYVIAPTGTDLIVLDRGSGRVVARWNDGRGVHSAPVFAWGRLYVLGNSGLVHALDIY